MKWSIAISNRNGIYKLPPDLVCDLRLKILEKSETSRKYQDFIE